jgi:hypothetical protein
MTSIRALVLTTAVIAAGIVGINGVAYAATGHNLILGGANSANHTTALKNTAAGPALSLKTRKTSPPLAVNSAKVVKHLNADLVDGLSASALQTRGIKYALPNTPVNTTIIYTLPKLPAGVYQASYNVVATMTTTGSVVGCDFEVNSVSNLLGYGGVMNEYSVVNGGGILDLRSKTATLRCFSSAGFFATHDTGPRSTVSLVRIDGVTNINASVAN